jgi:RecA/RadA recombinase
MAIYMSAAKAQKEREKLLTKLQKEGFAPIRPAEEAPNLSYFRVPTGIAPLDLDLGGGFPAGGISIIGGPYGTGKTGLLNNIIRMHQKLFGNNAATLSLHSEFPPDHMFMRKRGIQVAVPNETIDHLQAARAASKQPKLTKEEIKQLKTQVGIVDTSFSRSGPDLLNTVLEAYQSKLYGIIMIDSLTMLQSKEELARTDLNDALRRAAHASMVTDFSKKLHAIALNEPNNYTVVIATTQVRSKDKSKIPVHLQKYIADWDITGAEAMKHANLLTVLLSDGATIKAKTPSKRKSALDTVLDNDDDDESDSKNKVKAPLLGKFTKWEIRKGKGGTHEGIYGQYPYYFDNAKITTVESIIDTALRYHILRTEEDGSLRVYHGHTGEASDIVAPNRDAFYEMLVQDFDLEMRMRYELLAVSKIDCVYKL